VRIKVPCSYQSIAMGKLGLLMYLSELRLRVEEALSSATTPSRMHDSAVAHVGLHKMVFTSCCARINHPLIAPSHLHCPHYCNTCARLLRNIRLPGPPFVCHTPYNIGNANIVCRPKRMCCPLARCVPTIQRSLYEVRDKARLR